MTKKTTINTWNFTNQLEDLQTFLKSNASIIFISFILTFFVSFTQQPQGTVWGGSLIGFTYLAAMFFLIILTVQVGLKIFFKIDDKTDLLLILKNINLIMLVFFNILFGFVFSFALNYVALFPGEIGFATGMLLGFIVGPILFFVFMFVPAIFGKFFVSKLARETDKKDILLTMFSGFLIFTVFIPMIAFLVRNNWQDILVTPVFFSMIVGILILIAGIKKLRSLNKKMV